MLETFKTLIKYILAFDSIWFESILQVLSYTVTSSQIVSHCMFLQAQIFIVFLPFRDTRILSVCLPMRNTPLEILRLFRGG